MKKLFLYLMIVTLFMSCETEEIIEPEFKILKLEIGNWNMDFNESVALNMDLKSDVIIDVDCYIINDVAIRFNLIGWNTFKSDFNGEIKYIDNQIILIRTNSGLFDSVYFDDNINRGYVYIKYN